MQIRDAPTQRGQLPYWYGTEEQRQSQSADTRWCDAAQPPQMADKKAASLGGAVSALIKALAVRRPARLHWQRTPPTSWRNIPGALFTLAPAKQVWAALHLAAGIRVC